MTPNPAVQSTESARPPVAAGALAVLCAAKLLLHVVTSVQRYGYFRDELYYLDMARHLDWGYVDAAPLVAVHARVALALGGSLAALRILPALAGAALVALSMLLTREFGGGRYAQFLAGLCVILAPGLLVGDNLLTMNAFEPLFWMGAVFVLARILRTGESRLWPWFGVLVGLGLENKHSTPFFGFSIFVALVVTPERRVFRERWVWIAGAIALALFLPNLIWQYRHHFPTLEDLENVRREGKNVVLAPPAFVRHQIFALHPFFFPIWLAGVFFLFSAKRWRVLGLTFVVFFAVMAVAHAKDYYVFPIYPMAFAGGAAAIERWTAERRVWRPAVIAIVIAGGMVTLPLTTWMLSPEGYIKYQNALGFHPQKAEVHHEGLVPQPIGDQFGWPELARDVAAIYRSLPPDERARTGILAGNYGEAGAINLFGPALGLPRAYSRHQNHWYWGPPTENYRNLILLQFSLEDVRDNCGSYEAFPREVRFGMAEENVPIYLCRDATFDLRKVWPHYHHWN
jgi:hypothetical protein